MDFGRSDASLALIIVAVLAALVAVVTGGMMLASGSMMGGGMMGGGTGWGWWGVAVLGVTILVAVVALAVLFLPLRTPPPAYPGSWAPASMAPAAAAPPVAATPLPPVTPPDEAARVERLQEAAVVKALDEDERRLYLQIREAGGAALQRDLVASGAFSKAKVTRLLDKLERRGLVVRERYGATNRVRLTWKGPPAP